MALGHPHLLTCNWGQSPIARFLFEIDLCPCFADAKLKEGWDSRDQSGLFKAGLSPRFANAKLKKGWDSRAQTGLFKAGLSPPFRECETKKRFGFPGSNRLI